MRKRNSPSLVIAALTLIAAGTAVGVQPASAADSDDGDIEVIDAGDPDTAQVLRIAPEVGDTATVATSTESVFTYASADDPGEPRSDHDDVTQHVEITAVGSDGEFEAVATVTEYEGRYDAFVVPMESLVDVPLTAEFGADWQIDHITAIDLETPTDDQSKSIDLIRWSSNLLRPITPTEPVGDGATWTATVMLSMDGDDPLPTVARFELSEIVDDEYTVTVEASVDSREQDVPASWTALGDVTAQLAGTYTGSLTDPLAHTSQFAIDLTFNSPEGEPDASITGTYEVRQTSATS